MNNKSFQKRFMSKTRKMELISENEIIERKSSRFGTGAHVLIPKEHLGKKIKIIIEVEGGKNEK